MNTKAVDEMYVRAARESAAEAGLTQNTDRAIAYETGFYAGANYGALREAEPHKRAASSLAAAQAKAQEDLELLMRTASERDEALAELDETLELLRKASGLKTDFVFPNKDSAKRHAYIGGLKTAWRTCMRRCGFEPGHITPHDLRATYESYAHKAAEFTDTQREKMAGAAIDVQKKTYVHFDAHDIRGLEAVVKVDGLAEILSNKADLAGNGRGKSRVISCSFG